MTDRDAFIEAIKAAPDDDLPRLVYADWLEEHGEAERAEFIRVQCEWAALHVRTSGDADQYKTLRDREEYLLTSGGQNWTRAVLPGYRHYFWPNAEPNLTGASGGPGDTVAVLKWSRGFVSEVRSPSASWLTHGDAILRRHPVRRVRLTDEPAIGNEIRGKFPRRTSPGYRFPDDPQQMVLLTGDVWGSVEDHEGHFGRRLLLGMLRTRYPGVAFELPAERMPGQVDWLIDPAALAESDWSGISVELPAETWGNGMPMIPATPFVSDEEARVLYGDPTAGVPTSTISYEYDDPTAYAAPEPRLRRPDFSHRGWQPRFPRPR